MDYRYILWRNEEMVCQTNDYNEAIEEFIIAKQGKGVFILRLVDTKENRLLQEFIPLSYRP
jgi:hypothetical protein